MPNSFWKLSVCLLVIMSLAAYINIVDLRNSTQVTEYGANRFVFQSQGKPFPLKSAQRDERNYLTEEEALRDKPITDIRQATYIKHSSIRLADYRSVYNVGDSISLTIVLKNDYRIQKRKGGDKLEVRIFNMNMQAFAAGHVIDYDNGTYTAVVDALWPGKLTIAVTLSWRRELIRAVYAAQSEHKATSMIYGQYDTGKLKEEAMCHPFPEGLYKNNYTEMCNLTMDNSGMSWFCGKPSNQKILCEDWINIKSVHKAPELSDTELALQRFGQESFPNITVTVKGNKIERKQLPLCSSLNKHITWTPRNVTGYFHNNKWFPRLCNISEHVNYAKCLKDKRLLFFWRFDNKALV